MPGFLLVAFLSPEMVYLSRAIAKTESNQRNAGQINKFNSFWRYLFPKKVTVLVLLAGRAGRRTAPGAGRAGRGERAAFFACARHTEHGHFLVRLGAAALRADYLRALVHQLLKVFPAPGTVIFVYWHNIL